MINEIKQIAFNYLSSDNQNNESQPEMIPPLAIPVLLTLGVVYFTYNNCCDRRPITAQREAPVFTPPVVPIPQQQPEAKIDVEQFMAEKGFVLKKELPGESSIFLNEEHPDQLIKVGSFDPVRRAQQTREGRDFILRHGLDALVIPVVTAEQFYLVEERLPITQTSTQGQMELYLSHTRLFDQAVVDFFKLLCLGDIQDLTGSASVLSCLFRYPTSVLSNWSYKANSNPRYDNLPLYIDQGGKGKIGLIDLEHFGFKSTHDARSDLNWLERACKGAIIFFPHHFDRIVEEAKAFNPEISNRMPGLVEYRDLALEALENVYVKHAAFLKANEITVENPSKIVELSPEVKSEIVDALFARLDQPSLKYEDESTYIPLDYLFNGTAPDKRLFENIVNLIDTFNRFTLENYLAELKTKKNPTLPEIMKHRAIHFSGLDKATNQYDKYPEESLEFQIYKEIEKFQLPQDLYYCLDFTRWVKDAIYGQLVEKNIIALYVPRAYGTADCILF